MNNQASVSVEKSKWYQSSSFWTVAALFVGQLIVGFSEIEQSVTQMIGWIFSTFAGGKILRDFFKKGVIFDIREVGGVNFWGYASVIATQLTSIAIPDQLWVDFQHIAENLLLGNWQGAIGAVFSAIVIIANLFKTNKAEKA